jgi:hypothetical protein
VQLGERRRVVVLRVVAHREDRRLRGADPLALEELRVDAGRVVHAGARQRGGERDGLLPVRLDDPHAELLVEEDPRDRRSDPAAAEDDDVLDLRRASCHDRAPLARRVWRADHDHAVAGEHAFVPARHAHLAAADDRRHLRVVGDARVLELRADDLGVGALLDVELDDLHLAVGEDVRLARGGDTDRP